MDVDKTNKTEIDAVNGAQVIIANDNATVNVTQKNSEKYRNVSQKIKSRTKEYADKWNENMFLNNFDKRDENAGVNVKLGEVYINEHLPHYIWKDNKNERYDLKDLLLEYLYGKNESKMLLVLGQPGIGKSTLITWITANFDNMLDDILVYKIASDLGDIDWQSDEVSYRILKKLGLEYDKLNRKTIILDGLDEINVDNRQVVLNTLYDDLIYRNNISKLSLIITCRENYVHGIEGVRATYITLQPWDETQIRSFSNVFQEKTRSNVSESTMKKLIENRKILGIPLILYMILALNISIEKEGSIVDIYDKIFALEGGIYDRCIDNKMFADKHRIGEIKKQIHQISIDIAMWMFEYKPEEAYIPQNKYDGICERVIKEKASNGLKQDIKIGNFFKSVKHCEGVETDALYFIHRSLYEYFVSENIFVSICEKIDFSKEILACTFGKLLKKGKLSYNMLVYMKQKLRRSRLSIKFELINETFQLMLQNGMTYYTGKRYKNVIDCEIHVFANMLEIMHLWEEECVGLRLSSTRILKCCTDFELNLSSLNFVGANLIKADLSYANLQGADLQGAHLGFANLIYADLRNARLGDSDFLLADLRNANIEGAEISENDVESLENKGELPYIRVCLNKTKEVVSYEKYCKIREERSEKMDELTAVGIDFYAFDRKCDNEKIEILKEKGLDPAEFDILL